MEGHRDTNPNSENPVVSKYNNKAILVGDWFPSATRQALNERNAQSLNAMIQAHRALNGACNIRPSGDSVTSTVSSGSSWPNLPLTPGDNYDKSKAVMFPHTPLSVSRAPDLSSSTATFVPSIMGGRASVRGGERGSSLLDDASVNLNLVWSGDMANRERIRIEEPSGLAYSNDDFVDQSDDENIIATEDEVECGSMSSAAEFKSPIDEMRENAASLVGGDSVFSLELDYVMEKLVYALMDLDSAYLFRDFAGHFTEFASRFGPGCYDSHRAPSQPGWMLGLLLPLLHDDMNATAARVRVYSETSDWLQGIVSQLGSRSSEVVFSSGLWQRCVDHMGSPHMDISSIAFETASVIVKNAPLDENIVHRVNAMQISAVTESSDFEQFRKYQLQLLNELLALVESSCQGSPSEQLLGLGSYVLRGIECLESNIADTQHTFEDGDYSARRVRRMRPEYSTATFGETATVFPEAQPPGQRQAPAEGAKRKHRGARFFHRFMRFGTAKKTADTKPTNQNDDAVSVKTSKSTLRQKWRGLFNRTAESDVSPDMVDRQTVFTI